MTLIAVTGCASRGGSTSKKPDTVVYDKDKQPSASKKANPQASPVTAAESKAPNEVEGASDKVISAKTAVPRTTENSKTSRNPDLTTGPPGNKSKSPPDQTDDSEEERDVREAALKLIKNSENPESLINIKICYVTTDREWWVSIYDDLGSQIDIKSYIWDRENQRLRPFLVLTRIPKKKLSQHLRTSGSDRLCFVMDPPKKTNDEKPTSRKELSKP